MLFMTAYLKSLGPGYLALYQIIYQIHKMVCKKSSVILNQMKKTPKFNPVPLYTYSVRFPSFSWKNR